MVFLYLILLVLNFTTISASYMRASKPLGYGYTRSHSMTVRTKPHPKPLGYGGYTRSQPMTMRQRELLERSNEVVAWIRSILQSKGEQYSDLIGRLKRDIKVADIQLMFRDGVILCHAINILVPGSVKKISTSNRSFKQMENIRKFLEACKRIGVMNSNLFQINNLWDADNIGAVVDGIYALGKKTRGICIQLGIPTLGPAETGAEVKGKPKQQPTNVIGLQIGTNKEANKVAEIFGGMRVAID